MSESKYSKNLQQVRDLVLAAPDLPQEIVDREIKLSEGIRSLRMILGLKRTDLVDQLKNWAGPVQFSYEKIHELTPDFVTVLENVDSPGKGVDPKVFEGYVKFFLQYTKEKISEGSIKLDDDETKFFNKFWDLYYKTQ